MTCCTHCGIHLAKVDPVQLVHEVRVVDGREESTGRQWCSWRCREWTVARETHRPPPE